MTIVSSQERVFGLDEVRLVAERVAHELGVAVHQGPEPLSSSFPAGNFAEFDEELLVQHAVIPH